MCRAAASDAGSHALNHLSMHQATAFVCCLGKGCTWWAVEPPHHMLPANCVRVRVPYLLLVSEPASCRRLLPGHRTWSGGCSAVSWLQPVACYGNSLTDRHVCCSLSGTHMQAQWRSLTCLAQPLLRCPVCPPTLAGGFPLAEQV
jgi:hypothetical protein